MYFLSNDRCLEDKREDFQNVSGLLQLNIHWIWLQLSVCYRFTVFVIAIFCVKICNFCVKFCFYVCVCVCVFCTFFLDVLSFVGASVVRCLKKRLVSKAIYVF